MTGHTKLPWKLYSGKLRPQFPTSIREVQDASGAAVVKWNGFDDSDRPAQEHDANAAFIVTAVNAHDQLVAALHRAVEECEYKTPAGTTNCRYCDNNMDHRGTGEDMHEKGCVIVQARQALAGAGETKDD